MLRLSVSTEEYLLIGDNIKIAFLGGSHNHMRIMIDAPKEVNIIRSSVLEKDNPELKETGPKYCRAGTSGTIPQKEGSKAG